MADKKIEQCPCCKRDIEYLFHYPLIEVTGVYNEVYNVSKRFPKGHISKLFEEEVDIIDVPEVVFSELENSMSWPSTNTQKTVELEGFKWTGNFDSRENKTTFSRQLIVPFETINRIVTPHLEHLASFDGAFPRMDVLYPNKGYRSGTNGFMKGRGLVRFPPLANLKDFTEPGKIKRSNLFVLYTLEPPKELENESPELDENEERIFMYLTSHRESIFRDNISLDTLFGSMTCRGKLY